MSTYKDPGLMLQEVDEEEVEPELNLKMGNGNGTALDEQE